MFHTGLVSESLSVYLMSIYQEKICIIRQILFIQRHLQCVINPNERLATNALIWKVSVVAAALDLFAVASGVFRLGTPTSGSGTNAGP